MHDLLPLYQLRKIVFRVMHHPIYNRFPQSEADLKAFSLADDKSEAKRKHLFQKMLESLSEFEKLQLAQRLCKDILLSVAENQMSLDKGMDNVLRDALWILASDGIKLRSRAVAEEDAAVDPTAVPNGSKAVRAQWCRCCVLHVCARDLARLCPPPPPVSDAKIAATCLLTLSLVLLIVSGGGGQVQPYHEGR